MISCDNFRTRFSESAGDAEVLGHLRTCDRCLDIAAAIDPDVMFRALGGDMTPAGGVDAFVDDVMRQVRVRGAETRLAPVRTMSWTRRLAVAATLVAGVTGGLLFHRATTPQPVSAPVEIARQTSPVTAAKLETRPIIETYESDNATIFEVPGDETDNVMIVMIFDEDLPVDL